MATRTCPSCNGAGCVKCEGVGEIPFLIPQKRANACTTCEGDGYIYEWEGNRKSTDRTRCQDCNGKGSVKPNRPVNPNLSKDLYWLYLNAVELTSQELVEKYDVSRIRMNKSQDMRRTTFLVDNTAVIEIVLKMKGTKLWYETNLIQELPK